MPFFFLAKFEKKLARGNFVDWVVVCGCLIFSRFLSLPSVVSKLSFFCLCWVGESRLKEEGVVGGVSFHLGLEVTPWVSDTRYSSSRWLRFRVRTHIGSAGQRSETFLRQRISREI